MSVSSEKGVSLENEVAKILKKKLGARVSRDKRSGASSHQKMDLTDYFQDTPLDIECKNHKTIKIKEWFRQALAGASFSRIPTVVFQADDELLATVRFTDLVDLIAETQQTREEVKRLSAPITIPKPLSNEIDHLATKAAASGSYKTCRNGHIISDGQLKCLAKGCQFSAGYKPKKEKK
ncbi:hypothetical protein HAV21_03280 [Paenarthrobacter sp. MSM-2-10-13]|uniref:putative PDDEXK endonuclease n=1 Tax=Paenarthrobacter sp. MSM-2-10-13 TaxID=2717318 RepID=UPI001420D5B9|nr:hypothetical protein [Paenarthrobacter sp. MSM-2-10-13]NHW45920.1 hypothetical protein [Paenarthrobacter sp. MSM-2-10-13]